MCSRCYSSVWMDILHQLKKGPKRSQCWPWPEGCHVEKWHCNTKLHSKTSIRGDEHQEVPKSDINKGHERLPWHTSTQGSYSLKCLLPLSIDCFVDFELILILEQWHCCYFVQFMYFLFWILFILLSRDCQPCVHHVVQFMWLIFVMCLPLSGIQYLWCYSFKLVWTLWLCLFLVTLHFVLFKDLIQVLLI